MIFYLVDDGNWVDGANKTEVVEVIGLLSLLKYRWVRIKIHIRLHKISSAIM